MKAYQFDCGCKFPLISEDPLRIDFNPDIESIPHDCPKTWDLICEGNTKGVFQLETRFGQSWAKKVKPRNINELADLITIMRPGCVDVLMEDGKNVAQHYVDRKNGEEDIVYYHPSLESILNTTKGLLLGQEQAMQISQKIAGFTMSEADILRKCVAKGSLVYTQNGPRKIEDLVNKKNTRILTINDKFKSLYKKVSKVWSSGKQKIYLVTTEKGFSIELTDSHEVFTQRGFVKVKDLKLKEDFMAIPNNYSYKGYNSGNINQNKCLLISYIISEGYHVKTQTHITNKNEQVISNIKYALDNEFGKNGYKEYIHENGCSQIHLKNKAKEWADETIKHGLSRDKIIPNTIVNNTNGITTQFISHYFDAEGSVNSNNIDISSTSRDIIYQLQSLLLRDGIPSIIKVKRSKYKNEDYISYLLIIGDMKDVAKFYKKYKEYSLSNKFEKIANLFKKEIKHSNSRFLVPKNFTKSCFGSINLSSIFDIDVTGTIYNSNLTYDKANYINQMVDSELMNLVLNADFKFTKIKDIKYIGEKETYDFQVEDENYCFGFINGLLVHNSMGKKKPELMQKIKESFIKGCEKVGLVTKEEAEEIFRWIEKSQRYSFNRSHAISYALNGYLTAYAKAHFTPEFFTSYLYFAEEKQKPFEEIKDLINNARLMGVEIHGPDVRMMNPKFKLINKNHIYYGLTDIKEVGKSAIHTLEGLTKELNLNSMNWLGFLFEVGRHLDKTSIRSLISAGALSYLKMARSQMLYEYDMFRQFSKKEAEWMIANYSSYKSMENMITKMLELPVGRKGAISNKNRAEKVKKLLNSLINPPYSLKDNPEWIAGVEESLLGIAINCTKIDACDTSAANTTCKEFADGKKGFCCIAVNIDSIREHMTKGGNNPGSKMAFMEVSDNTCVLGSIVVFPDVWKEYGEILMQNNTVMIAGERGKKDDSFILKKAWQI